MPFHPSNFLLKVVKALSRNSLASTILGKDGVVILVSNIVTKLAKNQYGPRLKVAAEALSNLSKTSMNLLQNGRAFSIDNS